MSKLKAIKAMLTASNYIVVTDSEDIGSVSPLYAEKFADALTECKQRVDLLAFGHQRVLHEIADNELGEIPTPHQKEEGGE